LDSLRPVATIDLHLSESRSFMERLQSRVVNILTKPADEWRRIAAEPATVEGMMRDYAAPLAAIPSVCQFLGYAFVGVTVPLLGTVRYGIVRSFVSACIAFVFALIAAWIAAVVIEKLAPTFQSSGSRTQALKLVVYSMTPVWLAGILNLVPLLAILGIIAAFYAVYLFYLGVPLLMSTPPDKVISYMVVSALVIILVSVLFGTVAAALAGISSYTTL
jgi:hypothetical protein